MTQPPCKDCTDRMIDCHSGCGKYLAYREVRDAMLKDRKEKNDIGDYCKKAVIKTKFKHVESIKSRIKRRGGIE